MASKFSDWYAIPKNRKKLNTRRLNRYHNDPIYRNRVLEATRDWRKRHRKKLKHQEKKPKVLFTIGEVAKIIKVEQKTIRTLEKQGLIPKATDRGSHRRYTQTQIALIGALVSHRKKVHYKDPKYQPKLDKLSAAAHAKWGSNAG